MKTFNRKALNRLVKWAQNKDHKPLIIRGARQVGKSTLVRMFASQYPVFIELNMEKKQDARIFENIDTVREILNAIFLQRQINPDAGPILLFIDEIQESPKAIQQLRYFYEDRPEINVIAAGSLLEFALKEVKSFPVGRVEYMCLHPFDFEEYLMAVEQQGMAEELNKTLPENYAHDILLKSFHEYAIVGGMPAVLTGFSGDKNMAGLLGIYESIWQSYRDDVEKYARNNTERQVLRHIFESAPQEGERIKFEKFGNSGYKSREMGEAFRSLDLSRIIQLIYPTTSIVPPIVTDFRKRPRLQFLDTGLLNHALGLQGEMIGLTDLNNFFRGRIIQQLVTQQLISLHEQPLWRPHFWVRENKNSNAEIDLVVHFDKYIIPVEIKSGSHGRLRSLHQFIESAGHPFAVRLSAGNFSIERVKTPSGKPYILMNLPYYLSIKLYQYLEMLVNER